VNSTLTNIISKIQSQHQLIYLIGFMMLLIGLPFSKFLISLSQFILIGNWLLEKDFTAKWSRIKSNLPFLLIVGFFLLHILGFIYSDNLAYGLKDLKIKLPIFVLSLIVISSNVTLSKKHFCLLMDLFLIALFLSSLVAFYHWMNLESGNNREISRFISHIRFGLLICVGIAISFVSIFYNEKTTFQKIAYLCFIAWMTVFLFILSSLTSIVILFVLYTYFLIIFLKQPYFFFIKLMVLILYLTVIFIAIFHIGQMINRQFKVVPYQLENLSEATSLGNNYSHDLSSKMTENGYYTYIFLSEGELASSWNQMSSISYNDKDSLGQEIKATLIRFLTSKGLRKDAEGLRQLSAAEISAIEKGIPNVDYINMNNATLRIRETLWELNTYWNGGNPEGNSFAQRLEFWKTAKHIIAENFVFGVGSGDVPKAFEQMYEKTDSRLSREYRFRAHNQYLTIWIAHGIFGFVLFLVILFIPFYYSKSFMLAYYVPFLIIALISFTNEDTLETQVGVTFFATFYSLFFLEKGNRLNT
jgi:hypothetical protein